MEALAIISAASASAVFFGFGSIIYCMRSGPAVGVVFITNGMAAALISLMLLLEVCGLNGSLLLPVREFAIFWAYVGWLPTAILSLIFCLGLVGGKDEADFTEAVIYGVLFLGLLVCLVVVKYVVGVENFFGNLGETYQMIYVTIRNAVIWNDFLYRQEIVLILLTLMSWSLGVLGIKYLAYRIPMEAKMG